MDVRYFGNGATVLVLGEGDPRQVDDGRGNLTEVATQRVVILDPSWIEEVEQDQLLAEQPELHPDTGRPLSETENAAVIDPRGGPNLAQMEDEIARLRSENANYRALQDRSGATQVAAESQPPPPPTPPPATPPAEGTTTTTTEAPPPVGGPAAVA